MEQIEQIEQRFGCKVIQSHGKGKKTVEECEIVPHVTKWKQSFLPVDVLEMFKEHIGTNLKTRYADVHNESEGLYSVQDHDGKFLFVHADGTPATKKYNDLTGFRDGIAWACDDEWKWFQIDQKDNPINDVVMTHTEFLDKFFPIPEGMKNKATA